MHSRHCAPLTTARAAQVLSIPTESKLHEVTRHMDHVRKLTLFRQSHDTSPGAVLNLVRPSAAFRNVAGMVIDRGDHGGGDDTSPTAGGLGGGTAARLRRGGGGRVSMGISRQMSSPAGAGQRGLARASSPMLSPFLSRGASCQDSWQRYRPLSRAAAT